MASVCPGRGQAGSGPQCLDHVASTEEMEAAREHCDPATTATPLICSSRCIIISWSTMNNYNWTSNTRSMSWAADRSVLFSDSGISWCIIICSLLLMLSAYEIPHRSGAHAWGADKSGPWASKVRSQPWWERKYHPPCGKLVWRTFRWAPGTSRGQLRSHGTFQCSKRKRRTDGRAVLLGSKCLLSMA